MNGSKRSLGDFATKPRRAVQYEPQNGHPLPTRVANRAHLLDGDCAEQAQRDGEPAPETTPALHHPPTSFPPGQANIRPSRLATAAANATAARQNREIASNAVTIEDGHRQPDGMAILDEDGRLLMNDRGAEALLGFEGPGTNGAGWFTHPFATSEPYELEVIDVNGRPRGLTVHPSHIQWLGRTAHLISLYEHKSIDTEAEEVRRETVDLHDSLTGLPSRDLFLNHVYSEIRRAGQDVDHPFAVVRIDLDRFGKINAAHGTVVGDKVLQCVANRMTAAVRPSDRIARLGDDDFVILLPSGDEGDQRYVAERVLDLLSQPIDIDGEVVLCTPSLGVARYRAGLDENEMLSEADFALIENRMSASDLADRASAWSTARNDETARLGGALPTALEEGQLFLHYQPIFELGRDLQLVGLEALVRWEHPDHGLISPGDFIQIAEETGQISSIGEWVFNEAADQVAAWHKRYPDHLIPQVSINVTPRELLHQRFRRHALTETTKRDLSPGSFRFEITERALMERSPRIKAQLTQLAADGFAIDLDDFGTGLTSLTRLQEFPISAIKVDRIFVTRMCGHESSQQLVQAIIAAALALGLTVVAEGVETAEQKDLLYRSGCHRAQGYLLARPLTPLEAARFFLRDPATVTPRTRNQGLLRRGCGV